MQISESILEAIGSTPLVRLNKVVPEGGATVLAKCEYMNPTGSIKDRMAYFIIEQAEKEGILRPGGTIVENTSGNTGLGVAMTAAVKGYRCIFTMPDKMSLEKVNMLKAFGSEVVITPTDVPGDSPEHYVNVAKRLASQTPGAFYLDQYHNKLNIDAHYNLTGKEIVAQTGGDFDAFVAGTGTGGTVTGVARALKEHDRNIKVIGVDPIGSVHYHLFHTGTLPTPHVYKVEGVGEDIECGAMEFDNVDDMRQVNDHESFTMARRLVREEGLFCGGSSGSNVHIAVQIAMELGPGKTVITVLPDSATRYTTKYLSDAWMKDYGFLEEGEDLGLVEDIIKHRPQQILTASLDDTIGSVIETMKSNGVSQLPLAGPDGHTEFIVHEIDILRGLHGGSVTHGSPIREVANPIAGLIYPKARIEELYRIFETDHVAVVVDNEKLVGVVSQIDLIEFLAGRG